MEFKADKTSKSFCKSLLIGLFMFVWTRYAAEQDSGFSDHGTASLNVENKTPAFNLGCRLPKGRWPNRI